MKDGILVGFEFEYNTVVEIRLLWKIGFCQGLNRMILCLLILLF